MKKITPINHYQSNKNINSENNNNDKENDNNESYVLEYLNF